MYLDTWHRTSCPRCQAINWVNGGNLEDMTGYDPEAIECCKCEMKYWISEPMSEDDEPDEVYCDLGIKDPNKGK